MKKVILKTIGFFLLPFSLLLSSLLALATFVLLTYVFNSIILLSGIGLLVFIFINFLLSKLCAYLLSVKNKKRFTKMFIGIFIALFIIFSVFVLFNPMEFPDSSATETINTKYWNLPNGLNISYESSIANDTTKAYPVIWLHGGPATPGGIPGFGGQPGTKPLDQLSIDGYDVYHYHQLGCGLSSRLSDPSEYTFSQHISDLEEIRKQIKAEKIILIGQSFGATMAAKYLADYPERVHKIIFESPGPIWSPAYEEVFDPVAVENTPPERKEGWRKITQNPRFLLWYFLANTNPLVAYKFMGDEECDGIGMVQLAGLPSPLHNESIELTIKGATFYSFLFTVFDESSSTDYRNELRNLNTPALILRGQYDFIKTDIADEYLNILPNAKLLNIDDAGHLIQIEQAETYLNAVRAFLEE